MTSEPEWRADADSGLRDTRGHENGVSSGSSFPPEIPTRPGPRVRGSPRGRLTRPWGQGDVSSACLLLSVRSRLTPET